MLVLQAHTVVAAAAAAAAAALGTPPAILQASTAVAAAAPGTPATLHQAMFSNDSFPQNGSEGTPLRKPTAAAGTAARGFPPAIAGIHKAPKKHAGGASPWKVTAAAGAK
eukprot:scaffold143610_cov21-Tisochrysis_lutea.AAC.3